MWHGLEVIGNHARPAAWRTVVLGVTSGFLALTSTLFSRAGFAAGGGYVAGIDVLVVLLALAAGLGLSLGLRWRHQYPLQLTLLAAVAAVVLPVGPVPALLALTALIGRRRGPAVWWAAAAVALATAWATVVDVTAQPREASALKTILGPVGADPLEQATLEPVAVVGVIVGAVVAAIGAGLLGRARREAATAQHAASAARQTTGRLGDELARREERQRIAREVHDALGHRLSLLNLHAGALEANALADPQLGESARLVRTSASAALEDLRSLLGVLREPLGAEPPVFSLANLPQVVQDSIGAGESLSSSIYVENADAADPALARGVYRILQELLTNARKHAPGQSVVLAVAGGPTRGITIDARNRYLGPSPGSGSERGLAGIAERTELLGGQVRYGLDDAGATFRVTVQLPWREA